MPRPFRFGVSMWGAGSRDEWRDKARRAEAAGFDTMLVADHLTAGMFPPLTALVAAAEATDRLRLGTLVVNNDFRHPVVLAREAATVDLLTGGRLELGLGAGTCATSTTRRGFGSIRRRSAWRAWPSRPRSSANSWPATRSPSVGEHYQVHGHRCFPQPLQRPVPLLIGGNGRRVLETAGRLADIVGFTGFSQVEGERNVNPTHFTDAGLADQVAWVRDRRW